MVDACGTTKTPPLCGDGNIQIIRSSSSASDSNEPAISTANVMTSRLANDYETSPLKASNKLLSWPTYEATTVIAGRKKPDLKASVPSAASSAIEEALGHTRTTDFETILHLFKGYLGAGCLSLPFAVSQLGIVGGIVSIFALSYWTSANCYTVVNIKRHMEKTTLTPPRQHHDDNNNNNDEVLSETSSSNITYPEIGNWGYGSTFEGYVSACIITLQLAVCTVYVSFIGENLLAVAHFVGLQRVNHTTVVVAVLPFILGLAYLPNLKILAPVMAAGTILLMVTLATLGIIVSDEWSSRPEEMPEFKLPRAPLALCMILYSYEGINLILPVHAAMKNPSHFDFVFWFSMALVALCLAGVAVVSVLTFGDVTNGSLTAFLLDAYQTSDNSQNVTEWIMFANTAVSLSVLLTYPLTMYPAIELMGPIVQRNVHLSRFFGKLDNDVGDSYDDLFDDPVAAFEPLPALPEHDALLEEEPPVEQHKYGVLDASANDVPEVNATENKPGVVLQKSSAIGLGKLQFTLPGDSLRLRTSLVLLTFLIAVSVPNVQALISLVGALAGSSAALLIPPVLELAWVEHLEHLEDGIKPPVGETPPPPSPYLLRKLKRKRKRAWWDAGQYWKTKVWCYVSFILGVVFLAIGTGFSVMDIVNIYRGKA